MKRNWWVIISYIIAIIIFIILSIWVILFATGYKIDWDTNTLKKTGFILIETYPREANVKVAGQTQRSTPVTIRRLLPGDYLVEISKNKYRPWQANISVEPGLVTENRNVLLTFTNLSAQILKPNQIDNIAISPDNNKIVVIANREISLYNIKNKTEVLISDPSLVIQRLTSLNKHNIANGTISKIEFGPNNKTLFLEIQGSYNRYYLTLDSNQGKLTLLNKGTNLTKWQWQNNDNLLFLQKNNLYKQTISSTETKLLIKNIVDYILFNNIIYVITKDAFGQHNLAKLNENGSTKKELDEVPVAQSYKLMKINGDWVLITSNHNLTSIWWSHQQNGQLSWNKFASNITSAVLDNKEHLIYQSGSQIMAAKFKKLAANTEPEPIIILNNQPYLNFIKFEFDTLFYIDNNRLKSIDITGYSNHDLLPVSLVRETIIIGTQMHKVIFINAKTRQLEQALLRDPTSGLLNLDPLRERLI